MACVSAAEAEWDRGYSGDDLCGAASHFAGHQAGQHHGDGLHHAGEEAEAAKRSAEQLSEIRPKNGVTGGYAG